MTTSTTADPVHHCCHDRRLSGCSDGLVPSPDGALTETVQLDRSATWGSVSLSYTPTQSTTLTLRSTAFGSVPSSATIPGGGTGASFLFHSGSVREVEPASRRLPPVV